MIIDQGFMCAALAASLLVACGESPAPDSAKDTKRPADRVFTNGAVLTVNADRTWAEAVAIRDGMIVFVGGDDSVGTYVGEDTVVTDLQGRMLLPGFHDSHIHLLIGIATDTECDLLGIAAGRQENATISADDQCGHSRFRI